MRKAMLLIGTVSIMTFFGSFVVDAESVPVPDVRERTEQALRNGLEDALRALNSILLGVLQYQMPKFLNNGDIIIQRHYPKHSRNPERMAWPRGEIHDMEG